MGLSDVALFLLTCFLYPILHRSSLVRGELHKGTVAPASTSYPGPCSSILCPEVRIFSSSLHIPGAWAAAPELELRVKSVHSPLRASHLSLPQPFVSPGGNLSRFLKPDAIGTPLPGIGTLEWGNGVGLGRLAPQGTSIAKIRPIVHGWYLHPSFLS